MQHLSQRSNLFGEQLGVLGALSLHVITQRATGLADLLERVSLDRPKPGKPSTGYREIVVGQQGPVTTCHRVTIRLEVRVSCAALRTPRAEKRPRDAIAPVGLRAHGVSNFPPLIGHQRHAHLLLDIDDIRGRSSDNA